MCQDQAGVLRDKECIPQAKSKSALTALQALLALSLEGSRL